MRLTSPAFSHIPKKNMSVCPCSASPHPWSRVVLSTLAFALSSTLTFAQPSNSTATPEATSPAPVFVSGTGGYHTYRIPSLITTPRGTLLAFAEGRQAGSSDAGNIDLLLRRSFDNGHTWQAVQTVWDDQAHTCGNPCPVFDRDTGTLWLFMTWNHGRDTEADIIAQRSRDQRRVFVTGSTNDGATWSAPREITAAVKPTHWTWYATGPGAGIQIEHGPHRGRLVIPCDHIEATSCRYFSHVLFSDDHGRTWQLGGSSPRDQVNECEVVELEDSQLLLNMRNYDPAQRVRQQAISHDAGLTWTDQRLVPELIEPICQASIRRVRWPVHDQPGVILFSNPASERRERMTVRASFDNGRTWPAHRLIDPRPSAYSCLATLPDGTVGLLYETGERGPYESITFTRFPVSFITGTRQSDAIRPGEVWLDTDGHPIQAHSAGILHHQGVFYWYGENKSAPNDPPDGRNLDRIPVIGVSAYSSRDLVHWKNEGLVLKAIPDDPAHDLHPSKVCERPKVLFNARTKQFVMWWHMDTADYLAARAGVAVADHPTGPFRYLRSFRPHQRPALPRHEPPPR